PGLPGLPAFLPGQRVPGPARAGRGGLEPAPARAAAGLKPQVLFPVVVEVLAGALAGAFRVVVGFLLDVDFLVVAFFLVEDGAAALRRSSGGDTGGAGIGAAETVFTSACSASSCGIIFCWMATIRVCIITGVRSSR